jgi:prolyl-tRNA synthetase
MFLRTTEFLWQEGHTVHASKDEAEKEARQMHKVYHDFCRDYLALPVICGEKTPQERFPGAVTTFTIEAMMQDRKALQAGTSHFLGQNFAKSCGVQFKNQAGELEYGWMTSWGVTTRLIGGMVMAHSDDDGLILPPRVASAQLVIIPILNDESKEKVTQFCAKLKADLSKVSYWGQPLEVILDLGHKTNGEKKWDWVRKGVPLRLEIGQREVESGQLSLARRDKAPKDLIVLSASELEHKVVSVLDDIHVNLLKKAREFQTQHTRKIDTKEEFDAFFTPKNSEEPEIHGGFALCHWCEDPEVEEIVKNKLGVTIRCIPLDSPLEDGKCVITGKPSKRRVIYAKAY